ncbi:unnamed protein product [Haemonchus placei]|uniref:Protein lilliputian n=1 Tax=Haemonchus placei TaxID=6290 RepID=A0A0N4WX07_HAEPC|nr:unnamed protein product [Haemonchus placei]
MFSVDIKNKNLFRKVHRSAEEEEDEDRSRGYSEEEDEEKPRKRKKHHKTDPTLISIRDILSKVDKPLSTTPLSMPLPPSPISSAESQRTIASLPIVESDTGLAHSNMQPQYAYQPVVQPDGKTYYQQVLIVPGQVMSSGAVSSLNSLSAQKSAFLQEQPLQPKSIVQADYSVTAPTFPPPLDVFTKNDANAEPTRRAYPLRFVRPVSSGIAEQRPVQLPQSDPIAIPSIRATTFAPYTSTPKESLYTSKLPSGDEQRRQARVFREEATAPPRQVMKSIQESPLRIKTVDSRVEQANVDDVAEIRHLKHDEELKKALERHRLEIDPESSSSRKRKLRKSKKIKKLLKKTKYVDEEDEASSAKSTMDEFQTIRRMPETFEPDDEEEPKNLQSIEEREDAEVEEITEPPKKRRRSQKTTKLRKIRVRMEDDERDGTTSRSRKELQRQDDEAETTTATTLKRKILRLNKIKSESSRWTDDEGAEHRKRKSTTRSRRVKKVRRSRRRKAARSTAANSSPLRQHCLNIRTFARQFGTTNIEEFAQEHCAFIENYYPHLTCDKRAEYIAECQKHL